MIGYIPSELIYYTVFEYGKRTLKKNYRALHQKAPDMLPSFNIVGALNFPSLCLPIMQAAINVLEEPFIYAFCGGLAEICSATVWVPCDILQQKLMVQGSLKPPTYNGGIGKNTSSLW